MASRDLDTVLAYHQGTKHHFHHYARSLGYLDWDTQPAPFRRFAGAATFALERPDDGGADGPSWDALFGAPPPARPVDAAGLARFFWLSLALSAWKEVTGPQGKVLSRWALRVNPSSGNLHPTEGYLVSGPVAGLLPACGVFHYAPDEHLLEQRAAWGPAEAEELRRNLPPHAFLVGLSSIHWREAWKYGERAYRYCQHDVGHAVAALTLAARCLGWQLRPLAGLEHSLLENVLGTGGQQGPEKEHADLLLLVGPDVLSGTSELPPIARALTHAAGGATLTGVPNVLSPSHVDWSAIDQVAAACASRPLGAVATPGAILPPAADPPPLGDRGLPAGDIIRGRRSAVAMNGRATLPLADFERLLVRLLPRRTPAPWTGLPLDPAVSLVLFVHRVERLDPGLYCLVRHPDHEPELRRRFRPEFAWRRPGAVAADLPLFLLAAGDTREAARQLSCGQAIAADGVFSAGMLARFRGTLEEHGPAAYPWLFRETGMIGQMLYLEAEAAGLRGTGIGCFFDDEVHRAVGLDDDAWQSLYHFTVGEPEDDGRLRTAGAYAHLDG